MRRLKVSPRNFTYCASDHVERSPSACRLIAIRTTSGATKNATMNAASGSASFHSDPALAVAGADPLTSRSDLDFAIEAVDRRAAHFVQLLPVEENQLRQIRRRLGDLRRHHGRHRYLGIRWNDVIRRLALVPLHFRRYRAFDPLERQVGSRRALHDVQARAPGNGAAVRYDEFHIDALGLERLDEIEVVRSDVNLFLLEQRRVRAEVR